MHNQYDHVWIRGHWYLCIGRKVLDLTLIEVKAEKNGSIAGLELKRLIIYVMCEFIIRGWTINIHSEQNALMWRFNVKSKTGRNKQVGPTQTSHLFGSLSEITSYNDGANDQCIFINSTDHGRARRVLSVKQDGKHALNLPWGTDCSSNRAGGGLYHALRVSGGGRNLISWILGMVCIFGITCAICVTIAFITIACIMTMIMSCNVNPTARRWGREESNVCMHTKPKSSEGLEGMVQKRKSSQKRTW